MVRFYKYLQSLLVQHGLISLQSAPSLSKKDALLQAAKATGKALKSEAVGWAGEKIGEVREKVDL